MNCKKKVSFLDLEFVAFLNDIILYPKGCFSASN